MELIASSFFDLISKQARLTFIAAVRAFLKNMSLRLRGEFLI